MPIPVVANYFLAMGAIQTLNHLLGRGANRLAFAQRAAFHAQQMTLEERRLALQESQIYRAEQARREELAAKALVPLPLREGRDRYVELYLVYANRDSAGPGVLATRCQLLSAASM